MIYLGKKGLNKTWQEDFPKKTKCVHCGKQARIGFTYFEDDDSEFVCQLYENQKDKKYWLHDCCAVAVYFCEGCLEPTALYNQA